ncbi:HMGL-like family protein, partial [Vibrio parahaemolyticus V-223/04]
KPLVMYHWHFTAMLPLVFLPLRQSKR